MTTDFLMRNPKLKKQFDVYNTLLKSFCFSFYLVPPMSKTKMFTFCAIHLLTMKCHRYKIVFHSTRQWLNITADIVIIKLLLLGHALPSLNLKSLWKVTFKSCFCTEQYHVVTSNSVF